QFLASKAAESGDDRLDGLTEDEVRSPVGRFFTPQQLAELGLACGARRGDMLLIAADNDAVTSKVLDALRRHVAEVQGLASPDEMAFAFITEAPMFEFDEDEERWSAVHHLFTAQWEEDLDRLEQDPG